MEKVTFGFEKLEVWQKAMQFCTQIIDITEKIESDRKHYRLIEQLESSSASIACNIAEGKGRYSKREFIHYLYIARGSLYETITLLDIFARKQWINSSRLINVKFLGEEIGKMLSGLISSIKKSFT